MLSASPVSPVSAVNGSISVAAGVMPLRGVPLRKANILSAGPIFDAVLPDGGLRRGSILVLEAAHAGMTTMTLSLLGGLPERTWAGWLDAEHTLSGTALAEHGIDLEHLLIVRGVPSGMWAKTVSTLLDSMSVVVAELSGPVSSGDARRLAARARERGAVLLVMERGRARWPVEANVRCTVESLSMALGVNDAELGGYSCRVKVSSRGIPKVLQLVS